MNGIRLHEAPLLRVQFNVAESGFLLPGDSRQRSVHRFLGGTFTGRLSGTVLPGGGDKALRRADGTIEIDAYAILRTDDGVNILLAYAGLWRAKPGAIDQVMGPGGHERFVAADHYLRTTARFEAGESSYAWLNGVIAIGRGIKVEAGIEHCFFEIL